MQDVIYKTERKTFEDGDKGKGGILVVCLISQIGEGTEAGFTEYYSITALNKISVQSVSDVTTEARWKCHKIPAGFSVCQHILSVTITCVKTLPLPSMCTYFQVFFFPSSSMFFSHCAVSTSTIKRLH